MRYIVIMLAISVCVACNQTGTKTTTNQSKKDTVSTAKLRRTMGTSDSDAAFIPVDSANKMIISYLNSIAYQSNDTELRSITVDADALRLFLNSDDGAAISHMKIMFAHTLNYINNGHRNHPCGYRSGALTVILAGYDDDDNYIYYPTHRVLDNGTDCPVSCPTGGQAINDTLTTQL